MANEPVATVAQRRRRRWAKLEEYKRGALPTNTDLQAMCEFVLKMPFVNESHPAREDEGDPFINASANVRRFVLALQRFLSEKNKDELVQRLVHHVRLAARIARMEAQRGSGITIYQRQEIEKGSMLSSRLSRRVIRIGGSTDAAFEERRRKAALKLKRQFRSALKLIRLIDFLKVTSDGLDLLSTALSPPPFSSALSNETKETETGNTAEAEILRRQTLYTSSLYGSSTSTVPPYSESYESVAATAEMEKSINAFGDQVRSTKEDVSMLERGHIPAAVGATTTTTTTAASVTPHQQDEKLAERSTERSQSGEKARQKARHRRHHAGDKRAVFMQDISIDTVKHFPIIVDQPPSSVHRSTVHVSELEMQLQDRSFVSNDEYYEAVVTQGLKPLLLKCTPQMITAISDFFGYFSLIQRLVSRWVHSVRRLGQTESAYPLEWQFDANIPASFKDSLQLLSRMGNNYSLSKLVGLVKEVAKKAKHDYSLRDWLRDLAAFLSDCTDRQRRYMETPQFVERGRFLLQRLHSGDELGKYRPLFDDIYTEYSRFLESVKADPTTQELLQSVEGFKGAVAMPGGFRNIRTVKSALKHIRYTVLPQLLAQYTVIPLPRIEIEDQKSHVVLDDVELVSNDFVPGEIDVVASQHVRLSVRERLLGRTAHNQGPEHAGERAEESRGQWTNSFRVHLSAIHGEFRNVKFAYQRKGKGLWLGRGRKGEESGIADLVVGGKRGVDVVCDVSATKAEQWRGLKARNVRVKIDKLRLSVRGTSNDKLYKLIAPLLNYRLKKQLERILAERIRVAVEGISTGSKDL